MRCQASTYSAARTAHQMHSPSHDPSSSCSATSARTPSDSARSVSGVGFFRSRLPNDRLDRRVRARVLCGRVRGPVVFHVAEHCCGPGFPKMQRAGSDPTLHRAAEIAEHGRLVRPMRGGPPSSTNFVTASPKTLESAAPNRSTLVSSQDKSAIVRRRFATLFRQNAYVPCRTRAASSVAPPKHRRERSRGAPEPDSPGSASRDMRRMSGRLRQRRRLPTRESDRPRKGMVVTDRVSREHEPRSAEVPSDPGLIRRPFDGTAGES